MGFRLYDRTKSCRVNLYHIPFAALRRGFFLGKPVIPLRGTPEGLFFSHIDNLNRVKSVGPLLAYAGGVGWPSRTPARCIYLSFYISQRPLPRAPPHQNTTTKEHHRINQRDISPAHPPALHDLSCR